MAVVKDELTGSTPVSKVLEYLDSVVPDKFPREKLSEHEQGKMAGKFEILDLIRGLCGIKN